jgi:hypothetical protein
VQQFVFLDRHPQAYVCVLSAFRAPLETLRTDFPRFAIEVRSGPAKTSNKN